MSVLKAKRKASQFEVYHHFGKMRKEVVALLLRDFGYVYTANSIYPSIMVNTKHDIRELFY